MRSVSRSDGEDVELIGGLANAVEVIAVVPEDLVDRSLRKKAGVPGGGEAFVEEKDLETFLTSDCNQLSGRRHLHVRWILDERGRHIGIRAPGSEDA